MKKLLILCAVCFCFQLFSGENSFRFELCADKDSYPALEEHFEDENDYAKRRISELASLFVEGMTGGYSFVYVPSDKKRNIKEKFVISPLRPSVLQECKITFEKPVFDENTVKVWVRVKMSEDVARQYCAWRSLESERVSASGRGNVGDGFSGVKKAFEEALKSGVRAFYRTRVKNKPKEIRGKVLLRRAPLVGVDAGKYVLRLDFLLQTIRILEHTQF